MKIHVVWEGGDSNCKHDRLEDVPVPTGMIEYSKSYTDRNGSFVESKAHPTMKTTVRCLDCGATGKVA